MKNKEKYDLRHLTFENDPLVRMDGKQINRILLKHENMPIISFHSEKAPLFAILDWLEEDLEDY